MIYQSRAFVLLGLLTLFYAVQPLLAAETSGDEWEFQGAIYLWAVDIAIETASGEDLEIDFDTIVDDLDMVFMGYLGGQKDKWGFRTDVIYLDIEDDPDEALGRFGLLTLTDIELKAAIVTPVATYRVLETDQLNLNVLGGIRYLYLDVTVEIDPLPTAEPIDGNSTDGVVGFNGDFKLNKNWHVPFYYDVGKGDSELTYQAYAEISYRFSSFDLMVGYRYMKFKFDDGHEFGKALNHLTLKGPIIGARFRF